MAKITFEGKSYECGEHSVLDCLSSQGVSVPHSCRSGICQTCMMVAEEGAIPQQAQKGLKPTLVEQNHFLACACHPQQDMRIALPEKKIARIEAKVSGIEYLNAEILGIRLKPAQQFKYKAGQFINFFKDATTSRCYSLASVPHLDSELHLNVRKIPGGLVSNWISQSLKAGDNVTISEATGDCFYVPGKPEQDILLIGTSSGLAPLYGIIRDALANGHKGKMRLYHGNYSAEGFYLVDDLRKLEQAYANFSYVPCVSEASTQAKYEQGMVLDVAMRDNPDLTGWRVFLCGHVEMVKAAKRETYLSGASIKDIYADPF